MKTRKNWMMATGIALSMCIALVCYAAYTHQGEIDSPNFRAIHPQTAGTKLDSCTLCHRGGSYTSGGKTTTLGSCQWCHYTYGYNETGKIDDTLNSYGQDYLSHGRNAAAITAIQDLDSDGDGYPNKMEIATLRYPGDPNDTPAKVAAPSKVFTREQLEKMPQHTQFLLMNASKSTDNYAQYTGVPMEDLLKPLALPSATAAAAVSPDGFITNHPFEPVASSNLYHVNGTYPAANFFYSNVADIAMNQQGWCDYSAPSVAGRANGDPIVNGAGLKMLLAIKREGKYLDPGVLNKDNKLDGEGPFRVIPPQKIPGPPDQRSTVSNSNLPWPYNKDWDHNAGFSTRSTTMVRVDPLPDGTTDIDTLEAGWPYVDGAKIVVYGAISPLETIEIKLNQLLAGIDSMSEKAFKTTSGKVVLKNKAQVVQKIIEEGDYLEAYQKLQYDIMGKTDGCIKSTRPDGNDWLWDCDSQMTLYWAVHEIMVLLKILT